jgi:hypothetical protein
LFASILPTANKQWYTLLSIKNSMWISPACNLWFDAAATASL